MQSLQACLQAGWSKSDGIGRNAPTGSIREASRLGENWRNRKSAPTGSHREASRFGKNWQNRENAPTGSIREASRFGENWWNRENAPTGSLREASRLGENGGIGKMPQPEAIEMICTLFTGQPVRRVFLCVIVMSLN